MKYVWITIVSAVVATLIIVSIMLIFNKSQRESELNNAVNSASKEALESVYLEYSKFANKEEGDKALKERFEQKLKERIINGNDNDKDNNFDIEIEYNNIDSMEGILSAKVKEQYTHVGGGIGNITSDVTVLIDEELSKKQYNLSFVVNGRLYRNYMLNEGDEVIIPPLNCTYWKDENGEKLKNDDVVTKDKVYEAVFV